MDSFYLIYGGIFIVLLFLSAFFSGTEIAFFSISKIDLSNLKEERTGSARKIVKLLSDQRKLLITILTGNTLVNISAAIIATLLTVRLIRRYQFSETWGMIIEVVSVTFLILIFGEIIPKVFAVKRPVAFARKVVFWIDLVCLIFYPVSSFLERLTELFSKVFHLKKSERLLSEDELRTLIELGEEKGMIQEEEKDMIDSIFEFGETTVREIMVPRIDMVCLEVNTPIEKLAELIQEAGHSRIPIYKGRIDNIIGIIHAKDLIPFSVNTKKIVGLDKLARAAYFVPESKKIDELLREFQREKTHMAIVVDEYGGTAGLVTL
ncbi:MAG TPA: HlyC/CorC family transporter, partial [Bacteroidetes bacterium]|nr:HlyC/CorC family transporter [Bacteroidota bacterium]